ncbi:4-hydroxythreonine-4-phosphate dehydrogenase PdxA [Candidatus Pelagibacter sp.]|nr:4-hydroxythreonine-4-phosphate dehydrogenase PdxA [Candidatus Pelagibacter sp.]
MLSKLKIILLLITFTFIWSCGDKTKKISEIVEVDMEMQMSNAYKEGYFELQRGDVLLAAKKFNEAELLFPQSPWAAKSAIMAAYAYYTQDYYSDTMLIFNKNLSVSPLTTHLALKDVHKKITKHKIYTQVNLINKFYKTKFNKLPRIAITGLNPHCESNFKNSEEDKVIIPAIKKLRLKNNKINGPFPADTIFTKSFLNKYDVIIGMYHDQVLSPMKALFGFDAINITLGLPFTRISPDHGPNYSMLGKNLSDPKSLIQALKFLDK